MYLCHIQSILAQHDSYISYIIMHTKICVQQTADSMGKRGSGAINTKILISRDCAEQKFYLIFCLPLSITLGFVLNAPKELSPVRSILKSLLRTLNKGRWPTIKKLVYVASRFFDPVRMLSLTWMTLNCWKDTDCIVQGSYLWQIWWERPWRFL